MLNREAYDDISYPVTSFRSPKVAALLSHFFGRLWWKKKIVVKSLVVGGQRWSYGGQGQGRPSSLPLSQRQPTIKFWWCQKFFNDAMITTILSLNWLLEFSCRFFFFFLTRLRVKNFWSPKPRDWVSIQSNKTTSEACSSRTCQDSKAFPFFFYSFHLCVHHWLSVRNFLRWETKESSRCVEPEVEMLPLWTRDVFLLSV